MQTKTRGLKGLNQLGNAAAANHHKRHRWLTSKQVFNFMGVSTIAILHLFSVTAGTATYPFGSLPVFATLSDIKGAQS